MILFIIAFLSYTWPCNGEWAMWGDWSPCSASCGGGFTARMRMCLGGPRSVCTPGTWDVDAGVCNTDKCVGDQVVGPSNLLGQGPDPEPENESIPTLKQTHDIDKGVDKNHPKNEPDFETGGWSKCEDGIQYREVCDADGTNCEKEDQECVSEAEPEWGEWSECEYGWHYRERCDENFDCDWEEEECENEIQSIEKGWSDWSLCDEGLGIRSRERCTSEFGCEEEVEKCEDEEKDDVDLGIWGPWGSCQNGLKSRFKCTEINKCSEEEVMECFTNVWGEWGECKDGMQERSKCDSVTGCQTEQRSCGGSLLMGSWSWWSECDQGFTSRTKCNAEGENCLFEEKECEDWRETEWSTWTRCRNGLREREKCTLTECELELEDCIDDRFNMIPTEPCIHIDRMGFSVLEEKLCASDGRVSEEVRISDPYVESLAWEWDSNSYEDYDYNTRETVSWEWEGDIMWDVYVL